MKKTTLLLNIVLFLIISLGIFFSSCSKDDELVIEDIISNDQWKISYFWDEDEDEAYKFSAYTFVFNDDGTATASNGTAEVNGTWQYNQSSQKFTINFGQDDPFDKIEDDWIILEKSESLIKLQDDNTTKLEELHFEKS